MKRKCKTASEPKASEVVHLITNTKDKITGRRFDGFAN